MELAGSSNDAHAGFERPVVRGEEGVSIHGTGGGGRTSVIGRYKTPTDPRPDGVPRTARIGVDEISLPVGEGERGCDGSRGSSATTFVCGHAGHEVVGGS